MSVVKRLPPKQKVIRNFFFDSAISAIAPRIGAVKNTKRAVVPERMPQSVVALVGISILPNLKVHPPWGTITVAKYMGKRAAIMVVANAELAQSYIYHAKILFLSGSSWKPFLKKVFYRKNLRVHNLFTILLENSRFH
jgi:hypothetical protein